jgi:hypothetical protein
MAARSWESSAARFLLDARGVLDRNGASQSRRSRARGPGGGTSIVKAATRRLFVLDTNVLMHDPTAIFRFEEHDIYLPMVVLEELDANKKGLSEASRNARQVSRFLDDMMRGVTKEQIDAGLADTLPAIAATTARRPRRAAVLPDPRTLGRLAGRPARPRERTI